MPRPIPRPPPVTSTTRPSSSLIAPVSPVHRTVAGVGATRGRLGSLADVQDGSRKAIIAAFFANLGIAIAKFVGFVLTGRPACWPRLGTAWPTPATRAC